MGYDVPMLDENYKTIKEIESRINKLSSEELEKLNILLDTIFKK